MKQVYARLDSNVFVILVEQNFVSQGSNAALLERYPYLSEDSLYRPSTEDFTKRTITPVMASLAELLRTRKGYEEHYEWFVDLARNFHHIQVEKLTKLFSLQSYLR